MTLPPEAARLSDDWAAALGEWAIPAAILEAAPESPWGFPPELFARRGERSIDAGRPAPTQTTLRALEALGDGGTVLDVGTGGGATWLPLAARCTALVVVDAQADMLEVAARLADRLGVPVTLVEGRWPDIASGTPPADVAVCGHVAYNAPDLGVFLQEISRHARRRVVLELTDRHPLSWMNDLWLRFHGVVRPDRPRAADAVALTRALGFEVHRADRLDTEDMAGSGFPRREDAIALVRKRLCLAADRDDEVAEALGSRLGEHVGLWTAGPHEQAVVTLWWDVSTFLGLEPYAVASETTTVPTAP